MHHVYHYAEQVVVSLGEAYKASDAAIDLLETQGCGDFPRYTAELQFGPRVTLEFWDEEGLCALLEGTLQDHAEPVEGAARDHLGL